MPRTAARHAAPRVATPVASGAIPAQTRRSTGSRAPDPPPSIVCLAVFTSIAAGLIHAAVVPEHDDWLPSAIFFGSLAAFQLGWAVLVLLRPTRAALALGVLANLAAVGLWLWSRTAGMPFGPHKSVPEPFARTDVLAAGLQVAVVVTALWLLRWRWNRRALAPAALANGAIGALVAGVAAVALGDAAGHAHAPGADHGNHPNVQEGGIPGAPAASVTDLPAPGGGQGSEPKAPGSDVIDAPGRQPAPAADGHLHEH